MIVSGVLFVVSLLGVAAAVVAPGLSDLLLLAGPCALASLILLLYQWYRRRRLKPPPRWILVDGSNVLFWRDNVPKIETVQEVVDQLKERGFAPAVMFDANAGYLVGQRYLDDRDFAKSLGLPVEQVLVVPKGTQADPALLAVARDHGSRIVINDRYRDWAAQHPEVLEPGFLIRGHYHNGKLALNLPHSDSISG